VKYQRDCEGLITIAKMCLVKEVDNVGNSNAKTQFKPCSGGMFSSTNIFVREETSDIELQITSSFSNLSASWHSSGVPRL
jgi:hypothetical protein